MDETARTCPWCSSPIPAESPACPRCGAVVEGAAGDIPGLTTIDPRAPRGELPDMVPNPIDWLRAGREPAGLNGAYRAPSDEVMREIRRMEHEAEILAAAATHVSPLGDETVDAAPASGAAVDRLERTSLDPGDKDPNRRS